ncbi:hypothetical protein A2U01_0062824, partial [Trifolium medium]|nr:hypothetical protein [Trifolium medium]
MLQSHQPYSKEGGSGARKRSSYSEDTIDMHFGIGEV